VSCSGTSVGVYGAAREKQGSSRPQRWHGVLDEIGDMPRYAGQVLRVLEAREVLRVGAVKPVPSTFGSLPRLTETCAPTSLREDSDRISTID